jgi:hypothetical protein
MVICSTAILPNNNDISSGGLSFKLSCERVGRLLPAQKDSYKRVYDENGLFAYPKTPTNILRKKGNLYFHPLEIKATSEGTNKFPKFSLLNFFKTKEIPNLEKSLSSFLKK